MMWDNHHALSKKKGRRLATFFAERVGFKPTVRLGRTPDFESGPFDHSGIFPGAKVRIFLDAYQCPWQKLQLLNNLVGKLYVVRTYDNA